MLEVHEVSKSYKGTTVVDNVSFAVRPGTVTGFVGPNGAGKSTTMKIALGLVTPDAGTVTFGGVSIAEMQIPARTVGALIDASQVHDGRTARNHLRCFAALSGINDDRVDQVLAMVGLTSVAKNRVGGFSLGMRQRLGLASALLGDPEVLVLDEPANGLDPAGIRWLRESLRGFANRGGTVFISSHLISELDQFADDLVLIGQGRVTAAGRVADIMAGSRPGQSLEDRFLDLTARHQDYQATAF